MKSSWKVGSVVAAAMAGAVLLIPRSSCACMTPEMLFEAAFKVRPTEAGAVATRAAMLKVVPPGASAAEASAAYALLISGADRAALRCVSDIRALTCEYALFQSSFGVVRRGVRFAFHFDNRRVVTDISTALTTHVFGAEL